jgi:hypothetical protein
MPAKKYVFTAARKAAFKKAQQAAKKARRKGPRVPKSYVEGVLQPMGGGFIMR